MTATTFCSQGSNWACFGDTQKLASGETVHATGYDYLNSFASNRDRGRKTRAYAQVTGIPFKQYDVYFYFAGVTNNITPGGSEDSPLTFDSTKNFSAVRLSSDQITTNNTSTAYTVNADGSLSSGYSTAAWGDRTVLTPVLGKNVIKLSNQTATSVVIGYVAHAGAVAAIQIVDTTIYVTGDRTISSSDFNGGSATLYNTADNATVTISDSVTAGTLKVVSAEGKTLTLTKADTATVTISAYDFSTSVGQTTVTYNPGATAITGNFGVTVAEGATMTISGVITGTGTLNKLGTGTLTLSGANTYSGGTTVTAGTLKSGNATAFIGTTVTVKKDATFDINGKGNQCFSVELEDGASFLNSGANIDTGARQCSSVSVLENSTATVGGTGNFGLIGSSYAATTLSLGTGTLVKKGTTDFWLVNTTVSGAGMIRVDEGRIFVPDKGAKTTASDATISLNGGGLYVASGKALTVKKITSTTADKIENSGTLTVTELEGKIGTIGGTVAFATGAALDADTSVTLTGASTTVAGGTIALAAGSELVFDPGEGNKVTVDFDYSGEGAFKVASGTVVFTKYRGAVAIAEGATVGYTESVNDNGAITLPYTDVSSIKIYRADGTTEIADATKVVGETSTTFKFEPSRYGKSCLMEYLFKGTLASTGTDTGSLQFDGTHCFPGEEYVVIENNVTNGIYAASAPWRDVTFPSATTVVICGKMMKTSNACQIGIGSTTKGSKYSLFLASGDVLKNEVVLGYAYNNGASNVESKGTLCTMTVPNAQTTDHLYAFTMQKVGNDTVVNIYLDGEVLQPYTFKNQTVTLGSGIQLGSIHGGVGSYQDWPTDFGFKRSTSAETTATIQFLRVYNVVLTDAVMRGMAKDYPYVSPNGSFERAITGTANTWVEEGTWTNLKTEADADMPEANATIKLDADEGDATIAVNLEADYSFESMTFTGDAKITVTRGEGTAGKILSAGRVSVQTDVTLAYDAANIKGAPVSVSASKTLTFDMTSINVAEIYAAKTYDLTGYVTLATGASVTAIEPTNDDYHTITTGIDESTGHFTMVITPKAVSITVPTIENTDLVVTVDGTAIEPTEGTTYSVAYGKTVTATYTAATGYLPSQIVKTIDHATEGAAITVPESEQPVQAEASIGAIYYETIAKAIAAAEDGNTVVIQKDVTGAITFDAAKTITIDLAGKTWGLTETEILGGTWAILRVKQGSVTLTDSSEEGTGKMYNAATFCVWCSGGNVVIDAGTYENDSNDNYAVYVNGTGVVTINDGTFVNDNTEPYKYDKTLSRLNLNAAQTQDPLTGTIIVKGGTYTAEPKDDSGIKFVANGYKAVKGTDGIWTVRALATVDFTVTPGANSTATKIVINGTEVETAPTTITEDYTYEVTFTADAEYAFEDGATTATVKGTVEDSVTSIEVMGPDAVKATTPITPGEQGAIISADTEEKAKAQVEITAPTGVDKATYTAMFDKVAVETETKGQWAVTVVLKPTVATEVTNAVTTATTTINLTTAASGAAQNVSVTTKPGLYYYVSYGDELTLPKNTEGHMATETTTSITIPAHEGTKGFYRVDADVKPVAAIN